ncbi:MAG: hypothetical protein KJO07_18845 [Deltaproteobacteria bacterium]|nr:hypothetical protein [Deltaproteobacteria bacterium]
MAIGLCAAGCSYLIEADDSELRTIDASPPPRDAAGPDAFTPDADPCIPDLLRVTLVNLGSAPGTVTVTVADILQEPVCDQVLDSCGYCVTPGTEVSLLAAPSGSASFTGWNVCCTDDQDNPLCQFVIDADGIECLANFVLP